MDSLLKDFAERQLVWDIPILNMTQETRLLLFEQSIEIASRDGFVLPVKNGFVLAWQDIPETKWMGVLAMRAWACCNDSLTINDLQSLSLEFRRKKVAFAALSAWHPVPQFDEFLNTGCSVHVTLNKIHRTQNTSLLKSTELYSFGSIPISWIKKIIDHIGKTKWLDRHSKDLRMQRAKVRLRRTTWAENQLMYGDGLLLVRSHYKDTLGVYLMLPIDRSRQPFGGPTIIGINAIAGSFYERHSYTKELVLDAFKLAHLKGYQGIMQFQTDNKPMARIGYHYLAGKYCTRYDVHWYAR